MKFYLYLLACILINNTAVSQNNWWNNNDTVQKTSTADTSKLHVKPKDGKVTVKKDERIDELIKFKGETIPPAYGPQIDGFRVQIFFDNDRSAVNKLRAEFINANPETPTYIEFKAPNFNLKVGDCRTKLEAEKLKSTLLSTYPTAIVVSEKIYFPKVKSGNNDSETSTEKSKKD